MSQTRILFVEDDHVLNMATRLSLEDMGYSVSEFYCAASAIAAMDGRDYIAALLTDIDLGKGLDGFDVARHARTLYRRLPVVYVSGTMAAHHATHGVPGSAFLAKPCQPHQIAKLLNEVIRLEAA